MCYFLLCESTVLCFENYTRVYILIQKCADVKCLHSNTVHFTVLFRFKQVAVHSERCIEKHDLSGNITDYINSVSEEKCWIIKVPKFSDITIDIQKLEFESEGKNGLEITIIKTGEIYVFDRKYKTGKVVFTSDINITHYARNSGGTYWWSRIHLVYKITSKNREYLDWGVSWLKRQRSVTFGWRDNTPRAVVALFLASAVNFNGTNFEEELMANQIELKTSNSLLKSSITINDLSMLVNALLVTCYNPRYYHGINLLERLKSQTEMSQNIIHPVAYLALCNANETWPSKAIDDLERILSSTADYPSVRDMQAMAVMALSCYRNRNGNHSMTNESTTFTLYENTIERFIETQLEDGSFGNVYTTSLIAQALMSSDLNSSRQWNSDETIEYLMIKFNSSSANFLLTYLGLPILNGKTLVDVANTNCSAHPRKHGDDIVSIHDYLTPKIQVKYSLYIGDDKSVIHTILLKVPEKFTAYQIMELAEIESPKFKFERKKMLGKIQVFEIANIPNDPENGKYWLQYLGSANDSDNLSHSNKSPDELILKNGEHIVMWYKTAHMEI